MLTDTDLNQLTTNALNGYESGDMDTIKLIPHMVEAIKILSKQREKEEAETLITHAVIRISATRSDKNHPHGKIINWRAKAIIHGGLGETAAETDASSPYDAMLLATKLVLDTVTESFRPDNQH